MEKLFRNAGLKKSVRIGLIVLTVSILVLFLWKRFQWDSGTSPLIQTDAQIKVYQTAQYAKNGINNHDCYYGGGRWDLEFRYFPFHYPWVVYTEDVKSDRTCRFQYPSYLAQGFALLYRWTGYRFLNFAILLFYFLAAFLTVRISIKRFGVSNPVGLAVGILALTGYPQNSGFEYSETVISNVCFLLFLNAALAVVLQGEESITAVLYGFAGSLAVFLRSESVFYYFALGLGTILFFRTSFLELFKRFRFLIVGFLIGSACFAFYNYHEFGAVLGIRSKLSYSDFLKLNPATKLELLKGYFFGSSIQVGLFSYCLPMIAAVIGFSFLRRKESDQGRAYSILLLTGILGMLLVQTFSPYNPGGLYAGLRFTEISYYCFTLLIGIAIHTVQNSERIRPHYAVYVLCVLQILFCLFHTRKNIQVVDFVKKHHEILQKEWSSYPDFPVVHKSLFDMFLVSTSYLDKPHFVAKDETSWKGLESILDKNGVPGIQVFYFGLTPPKDINAPQDFYDEWINTKYEVHSTRYALQERKIVEGFVLERYVLNSDKKN
ncbi:LA_3751/LA_3752 family putative glycosyltransferase [Leptospira yasudae]|uniref:LA_3751/LA_3752 family putative glycosyltransferase n=1 Tax=Leptospira yasudae TaxID=2202201 RepID=UPI003CCFF59D